MSPETSGKKRRPITANAQIWEVHLNLEKFRARLSSKKESKGDERWRLSFKNKLPSYSHAFVLETALTISFNKLPRSFNLFNGSRLYYGTIKCEISSAFCSVTTYNPAVALTTEKLYEQMTSNQASTKRQRLSPKYSCPEINSLVTYHTPPSLYVCAWLVDTLSSTVLIGSPIIYTWALADICLTMENEFYHPIQQTFVVQERVTNP